MLLYTPPNSHMAMGTVMLSDRPALPVSPAAYRILLAKRLQAMMVDTDHDELDGVLGRLETQENLRLLRKPSPAEILVENSPTLRDLAAYPVAPVLPIDWQLDPETAEAVELGSAIEYLELLLR